MATILSLRSIRRVSEQAVRESRPYYDLGCLISGCWDDFNAPADMASHSALDELIASRDSLQRYLVCHQVNEREGAVQFLTRFAAVALGHDGRDWSAHSVQRLAEGLIGCLDLMPSKFERSNLPVIDDVLAAASMSFNRQMTH